MPTYVYECSACNEVYEVEQRITEDPLKDCKCGSQGTVKRLIQPTAIMFKGSGFYVNDSAKHSPSPAKTEESTATECTGDQSTCACNPANVETKE
ncbi:MAG: zinc ribbon domain-containing protein [Armatimonadetes bacterium]|nr:zinc ribbon domain-containing protein [Armatimonadota bacterium]MBS1728702.1 zinc ribbon domain-containing protein [Armatimonadota bacterium]